MPDAMYCGIVDDFAIDHGIGSPIKTLKQLNSHLVSTVLFGDELVINDGHVVLNPAVQSAILNDKKSPFRRLVTNGFVQILTRYEHSIEKLADFMHREGIPSATTLLGDPWYEEKFEPELQRWSSDLVKRKSRCWRDWPPIQTNYVYKQLAARALDALPRSQPDLAVEVARFERQFGETIDSRRSWEAAVTAASWLSPTAKRSLMLAAHESYNYMWGSLLSSETDSLRIQAPAARLLQSMDASVGELPSRRREPIKFFVPRDALVSRAVGGSWERLDDFTDYNSDVYLAKIEFRASLDRYYTGRGVNRKQMREVADAYGKALIKVFGPGENVSMAVGVVLAVGGVVTTVLAPPAAIAIGAAAAGGGLGLAASTKFLKLRLLSRVSMPRPSRWIEERDVSSSDTWFKVDPGEARGLLAGAPRFAPKTSSREQIAEYWSTGLG